MGRKAGRMGRIRCCMMPSTAWSQEAGALETMRHTVHTQWTASPVCLSDAPKCVLDLEACVLIEQSERSERQETPMCLPNMLAKVCGERSKGAPALAQVATNKPCVGHHAHAAIFVRALRAAASSRRHATPRCYKGHGQHRADRAQHGMTDCTTTLHHLMVRSPCPCRLGHAGHDEAT